MASSTQQVDDTKGRNMNYIQLNSCNSNFYNSKNHLNRKNYLVPSEFTYPYKKAPIIRTP